MIEPRADRASRVTVGADKGYDTEDFVNELRAMNATLHVAAKAKGPAIDARTTRPAGYAISQRIRKKIEEAFGWSKTIGPIAKTMLRTAERVGAQFTFTLAAYNLVRLPKLPAASRKEDMTGPAEDTSDGPRNTVPPASLFHQPARPHEAFFYQRSTLFVE